MVDAGEFVINDVFKHHAEVVGFREKRGVSSDVLANIPEDSTGSGLGGAGAEELGATEPDGGYAVVLLALAPRVEVENHARPRRGAAWGRSVGSGVRWGIDRVREGVVENMVGARWGGFV